jgi:uncharacterized phage protein gp47/JayE
MSYAAPTVGAAGLTLPTYPDILASLIASYQTIYGQDVYLGIDSADYQWISIVALKLNDAFQTLQLVYNARSPSSAVGADLDGIVKVNGIARLSASFGTAVLSLTGTAGAVLTNAIAQDANGFLWDLPSPLTFGVGGTVSGTATCETSGNVNAAIGQITGIATPQPGWTSVTNAAAAIAGAPIETDSQLRARQALSVSLPSETRFEATVAAIAGTLGVTRYTVLENPTASTDSYGNPQHSISAVVEGGNATAIAQAIYDNRGIGSYTNGTTVVNITDAFDGTVMPIRFTLPSYVPIFVSMSVHGLAGFTSANLLAIQAAIVTYLNSLQIGELVVQSEIIGAALSTRPNPLNPLFAITATTLGTSASPTGTASVTPLYYQVASGTAANVIITSV